MNVGYASYFPAMHGYVELPTNRIRVVPLIPGKVSRGIYNAEKHRFTYSHWWVVSCGTKGNAYCGAGLNLHQAIQDMKWQMKRRNNAL